MIINFIKQCLITLCLCVPALAWAANIQVYTDRNPVGIDESFSLVYKSADSLDDDPDFSVLEPFIDILNRSQSSNISIINGDYQSSKTWTLSAMPRKTGQIELPPVSFGSDKSPAYQLNVVEAKAGPAEQQGFFTRLELDQDSLYVQQQLVITQRIYSNTNLSNYEFTDLKFSGVEVMVEALGEATQYARRIGQQNYLVVERRLAVFPTGSGTLNIEPSIVGGRQSTGRSSFFNPFGSGPAQILRARTKPQSVEVKPIPSNAAAGHWLPAKRIVLSEEWSENPLKFVVGEPVTRTISLQADGLSSAQLPELAEAEIDGLKQYPDQPVLDDHKTDGGIIGGREQKIAFIPLHNGKIELPEIRIPWWNTEANRQETATLPARTIEVTGGAAKAKPQPAAKPAQPALSPQAPMASAMPATEPAALPERGVRADDDTSAWFWVSMALTFVWLLTLLLWYLKAQKHTRNEKKVPEKKCDQPAEAFKALSAACDQADLSEVRSALIHWARSHYSRENLASLKDIASRLPDESAAELTKMDALLYGGKSSADGLVVDFALIKSSIKQVMLKRDMANESADGLEPLYHH